MNHFEIKSKNYFHFLDLHDQPSVSLSTAAKATAKNIKPLITARHTGCDSPTPNIPKYINNALIYLKNLPLLRYPSWGALRCLLSRKDRNYSKPFAPWQASSTKYFAPPHPFLIRNYPKRMIWFRFAFLRHFLFFLRAPQWCPFFATKMQHHRSIAITQAAVSHRFFRQNCANYALLATLSGAVGQNPCGV